MDVTASYARYLEQNGMLTVRIGLAEDAYPLGREYRTDEIQSAILREQMNMLGVVVLLGGDGDHHVIPRHAYRVADGGLHVGNMLQHLQHGDHVGHVFSQIRRANVVLRNGQAGYAALRDIVQKSGALIPNLNGMDGNVGKRLQKGEKEHTASAAHVDQGLEPDALEKAQDLVNAGERAIGALEVVQLDISFPSRFHQNLALLGSQIIEVSGQKRRINGMGQPPSNEPAAHNGGGKIRIVAFVCHTNQKKYKG